MKLSWATRDYPRVCGGTGICRPSRGTFRGLSPRVRGNPGQAPGGGIRAGTIPACAGEPPTRCACRISDRDYPRVCGGTFSSRERFSLAPGLSPRVRGNRGFEETQMLFKGTIPACAGEPTYIEPINAIPRDYPRVCGGTRHMAERPPISRGLSPRVRGNLDALRLVPGLVGTIPACAGEPRNSGTGAFMTRDYPRVCGGTLLPNSAPITRPGLSPRVRGNRRRFPGGDTLPGTIPACAGEPLRLYPVQRLLRDYPRVCGGTLRRCSGDAPAMGLSPRVRGNLAPAKGFWPI